MFKFNRGYVCVFVLSVVMAPQVALAWHPHPMPNPTYKPWNPGTPNPGPTYKPPSSTPSPTVTYKPPQPSPSPSPKPSPSPSPSPKPAQVQIPNSGDALADIQAIFSSILGLSPAGSASAQLSSAGSARASIVKGTISGYQQQIADLKAQVKALTPGTQDPAGLPACAGSQTPINQTCATVSGYVFKRVSVVGFGEAWQIPTGQIFSDIVATRVDQPKAASLCAAIGGRLPTMQDFRDLVGAVSRDTLPHSNYSDINGPFGASNVPAMTWSSTSCSDVISGGFYVYRLTGMNQETELKSVTSPVCHAANEIAENSVVSAGVRCVKQ